ncbi:1-acylglycerol-3-phosphate O-acyltransferase [Irineochytrium annulatum]|nr:1-acylglycerol-3-phosphate O-acyltransferase [Irineochytrium annulatum]
MGNPGTETAKQKAAALSTPLPIARRFIDTPQFIIRQTLFLQALAVSCLYGATAAAALLVVGKREKANSQIAWMCKILASPACGIRGKVEGEEYLRGDRPAVFVCNHQSFLDLLALGYMFPPDCVIMAKSDLIWAPFIGQYLWAANNVFINRNNTRSALDTMKMVADELTRKKMGLFMFPEGTRSHQTTNDLLPFKKVCVLL